MQNRIAFLPVSSGEIIRYYHEAKEFFNEVLDLNYDMYLISDDNKLFEYSGNGIPQSLTIDIDNPASREQKLQHLFSVWDRWVIDEIYDLYHVKILTTNITLVDLLRRIRDASICKKMPH